MSEQEIYIEAQNRRDPAERRRFLDEACAGNEVLRERIETLILESDQLGSFLESSPQPLGATADISVAVEKLGAQIGPYKLLQQIGEGGMGAVFMAEQSHPVQRMVALKLIKAGMDSGQVIARFEAERQALALMDHPNIAKVLDAGTTAAGRPYFVMELVKGVPITQYCDENHLPPKARLQLFTQVCHAVQHAHQKGIIHRDIKPNNVLVTLYDDKPVPKVIDFGVAKATGSKLTDRTMFTGFGQIVGTLEYMSPEQARLNALDIDTRGDIYSLGVLLYELLTGTTPFDKKRLREAAFDEMLRMIREEEPPKPSTRLSTSEGRASIAANRSMEPGKLSGLVRGELDWIVMKALEKDRNRRYETANGFAIDVQRYLNDEAVQACPPSASYRLRKFARRYKGPVLGTFLLVLALVSGVVGTTWGMLRARNAETDARNETKQKRQAVLDKDAALKIAQQNFRDAKEQETLAKCNEKTAQEQELLAGRRLYAAQMNLAMQAWEAGHPARVLELLESQRPRFDQKDLRAFEWYYLWQLCQGRLMYSLPTQNYDNAQPLAYSPDGKTLASGYGSKVKIWDAATGREVRELRGSRRLIQHVTFAPDGKTLASCDGDLLRIWDLVTWEEQTTIDPQQNCTASAFSADGKTFVVVGSAVKVFDLASGRKTALPRSEAGRAFVYVACSPDGQTVAASSQDSSLWVWMRDGAEWREVPQAVKDAHGYNPPVAISPDNKLLAVGREVLKIYSLPSLQEVVAVKGHIGRVHSVAFTGDSKTLVTAAADRTVRLWEVVTGEQRLCLAHHVPVSGVVPAPDGQQVAAMCADGVRVWNVGLPVEGPVLRHSDAVYAVAFSRDGKTLASTGLDATRLWNPSSGQEIDAFPAAANKTSSAVSYWSMNTVFSPDGKILATNRSPHVANAGAIDLWNLTDRTKTELIGKIGHITGIAFLPDGQKLASVGTSSKALLWDLAERRARLMIPMPGGMTSAVAVSPDGKTLAIGHQFGIVKLFDTANGRELATLQHFETATTYAFSLAFSPDGKTLAAGDREGTVKLWDIATGQLLTSFKGHTNAVRSLSFSKDGGTLASASEDHTARLWDVSTGQERATLTGHQSGVYSVAFAPDGNTLVTGSVDHSVRLWRAATDANATAFKRELDVDDPDSPVSRNELGDRLWQYGGIVEAERNFCEALTRLEKLAAAFPDDAGYQQEMVRSWLSLHTLLMETGKPTEAEQARGHANDIYQKLSAQQQQSLLWNTQERGRFARSSGNLQQAERITSQMQVLLSPASDSDARAPRRSVLQNKGETPVAIPPAAIELTVAGLQGGVRRWPDHAEYHRLLGELLQEQGQNAEAETAFRNVVRLKPDEEEGFIVLAEVLRKQQKFAEAESTIREAIRLEPARPGAHAELGWLLTLQSKFVEAECAFREVIRLNNAANAHFGLGRAQFAQEKFAEAEVSLREAIKLNPKLIPYAHAIGNKALASQGKPAESNESLKAETKQPSSEANQQNDQ